MNRREWIKTFAAAVPAPLLAVSTRLETEIVRLRLRHTWTTTMSSSDFRDTLHVHFHRDGITGRGEGAPIVRYHENAATARQAVESLRGLLTGADPWRFSKLMGEVFRRVEGQYAAKAAIDIALMDGSAKGWARPSIATLGWTL